MKVKERCFLITGIAHTAFFVEDVERSLHFYCEILGFKKLFNYTGERDGHAVSLTYVQVARRQFLELFQGSKEKQPWKMQSIGFFHFCLEVDDLDKSAELMKSNNIPFFAPPHTGPDGTRAFWIEDPDGNKIEFMQFLPDCMQIRLSQI